MPGAPALAATGEDGNPFPGTHIFTRSNGEVLYCRYEPVAGTRIPKRVCATEEVMRNQAADSRRFIDLVREGAAVTGGCVPGTGSGC